MKQIRQHIFTRFIVLTGMLLMCLMPGMAFGQSNDDYTITWDVQDSGGGLRISPNYTLSHSIGQTVGGLTSSNDQYQHVSGVFGEITADGFVDYKMYEDPAHSGLWHDAEQSDTNMCWNGSGSNGIDWGGWEIPPQPETRNEQQVYDEIRTHWENKGSLLKYVWRWWIDGTEPPNFGDEWAKVLTPGGGYHAAPAGLFAGAFFSNWQQSTFIQNVKDYLHNGYATGVVLYDSTDTLKGGHILTVWGYRADASGTVIGLWVTDSDDQSDGEWLLPVTYSIGSGSVPKWRVPAGSGTRLDGWLFEGVQALKPKAITTPSTEEPPYLAIIEKACIALDANDQIIYENGKPKEVSCPENMQYEIKIPGTSETCDTECTQFTFPFRKNQPVIFKVDPKDPDIVFLGWEVNGEWQFDPKPYHATGDVYLRPGIGRRNDHN